VVATREPDEFAAVVAGGRRRRRPLRATRNVVLGSERRIGLWILPLFLITGLLGATLAGALAVLYYGQKVDQLETTTAAARAQLDEAKAEVDRTASEARDAIDAQVDEVERRLAATQPIASPNEAGVYAVSAEHPDGEVRVGSAFTIFSDKRETYFLTNYRLVATDDGFAVPAADVFLPDQRVRVQVYNFDAERDLAVLVARGGVLPVLEWRAADQPLARGDTLFLAGIAGTDTAAVVEGSLAAFSDRAVVPVLPFNGFLSGGPLLDGSGKAVAISSLDYAPFGEVRGDLTYAVPIRAVCERLIRCTPADVGAGGLGDPAPTPPPPPTPPTPDASSAPLQEPAPAPSAPPLSSGPSPSPSP
jgi:S1-C subfamily serine protease